MNNSQFDEIYINGINTSEQYFFIDGEKTEDPNELTITCDKCGNVIKFKRSDD